MSVILNSVFNVDARQLKEKLEKATVDVIITSPPYADLKDYGINDQIGHGQDYDKEYLPALGNVFKQCFEVAKETGSLWIIVDTFKKKREVRLLPFEIASICRQSGWILSDVIIWDKGKTLPWSHKGRFRNLFEYILFFTKSTEYKYYVDRIKDPDDLKEWWVKYPERYSLGGKNPSNIWKIPIPVQGSWSPNGFRHFCPFPPELIERILLLTTDDGDTVLDPFAGSCAVLSQAFCMKRNFVGFEINPDYVKLFETKVLPDLIARQESINEERKILDRRRREFERKVKALRAIKYPKSVFKMLQKKEPSLAENIKAIFVAESSAAVTRKTNKFMKVTMVFILGDESKTTATKEAISSLVVKPPLSKYGIEPQTDFRTLDGFFGDKRPVWILHSPMLYVYQAGRTHYYDEKVPASQLEERISNKGITMARNGYPPIISSTGIRQKILRTWRPRMTQNKRKVTSH